MDQEKRAQDTGAVLEAGVFTATYPKDSPHFEDFAPAMWVANVSLNGDDERIHPVSFRCRDGRSWNWEPLS